MTLSTLLFGELLAGAVLTEQIFTIPGFGKLIVDAVFNRDYAVVQGVVLCTAVGFIFMNLLADVLYVLVNPRLRHAAMTTAIVAETRAAQKAQSHPRKFLETKSAARRPDRAVLRPRRDRWPLLAPYDPIKPSFTRSAKRPRPCSGSARTNSGAIVSRAWCWGARASIMAGVVSVAIAFVLGVPFGLVSGYFGGWTTPSYRASTEAMLAIPFLIFAIALAAFLGPSLTNAMIAIGLSAMPIFIRLTRGQVLTVKAEDYVEGARAIGLPNFWIILRYILPNVLPPILVQATLTVATAIIAEASLSFLGLGQQPPNPSWGSMLNTAKNFM